ncbi:MAG: SMC-Scp complex subunit ScpB [Thermoguttaceae bacterium]|jgi:segregation and condensation protein B
MSQTPEPPTEPCKQEGISLDELAQAFAQVMGAAPRPQADAEQAEQSPAVSVKPAGVDQEAIEAEPGPAEQPSISPAPEDACPVSPLSILEAMFFVGNRDNRPLSAGKAAELMRDVAAEEIPLLVEELNQRYAADNCPYQIVGEGDGYRLTLRKTHSALRNKFYGRIHEARLSQAAIDILAIVAYQQPLTGERVSRLRGKPSSHILTQLVRRGLLRIQRPDGKRRTPHYYTTERFLRLFNLQSLDDLPRSEDTPT